MITIIGCCVGGNGGGEKKTPVQTFSNRFLKTLTVGAVTTGAFSSLSQPSPKTLALSFGGGSHLGVPSRGALLGPVEREEGKTRIWH